MMLTALGHLREGSPLYRVLCQYHLEVYSSDMTFVSLAFAQ